MQRRRLIVGGGLGLALGTITVPRSAQGQDAELRVIEVLAREFEFVPSDLELERGVPVELVLTASEVLMGFHAPGLKLRAEIAPGQPVHLRFVPTMPGSFEFHCDVFCGEGHEDMSGRITVRA
jgi:cytochrome c oxidase subunit 2